MKRTPFAVALLFLLSLLWANMSLAQVATGVPPFASMGGGPFDSVNLGNLNAHFAIPIVHKAGRGIPFDYDLTYDSSIWTPVGTSGSQTWQPAFNWGWQSSYVASSGYITFKGGGGKCPDGGSFTTFSNFVYHDPWGINHPFPGVSVSASTCTTASNPFPTTTKDGSGLTLKAVFGPILTPGGASLSIPHNLANGSTAASTTHTDANGNQITSNSSGGFTDTLNTPVLTVAGSVPSPITFQYLAPSGPKNYSINYSTFNVKTNFGCSGIAEYTATNVSLVSSVSLPDGTAYSFTYEPTPGFSGNVTGRLQQVTLPAGGTIVYSYPGSHAGVICGDGSAAGLTRTLSPGGQWTYTRTDVAGNHWQTKVTTPPDSQNVNSLGDDTVIDFQKDSATSGQTTNFYEVQRQSYQGAQVGGTLLNTTITCYNAHYSSCSTSTVSSPITEKDLYSQLPNGQTRLSQTKYNGSGLVTDNKDYDYGVVVGSAPTNAHLIRETATTYAALGNGIINKPASIIVSDWSSGTAVTLSSITYTYDEGTPTPTSGTLQHVAVSGSRGNPTTMVAKSTSTTTLTRRFSYYDTGTPNVITDVNGAQTTFILGTTPQGSSTISCGNSFPTTINESLGLSRSMRWDCGGGIQTSITDENTAVVSTGYADANYWRPTSVVDQDSNQTNLSYVGLNVVDATLANFNGGQSTSDGRMTMDSFGRPILSQRLQGPAVSTYDTVETDYNNIGLPYRTTLPFTAAAGTSNSSAPGTNTSYDALGRIVKVQDAGGGQTSYTYTNNDVLQTVMGTQSFAKQLEYDGLGRLVSVCEMTQATGSGTCGQSNPVTGFWTKYTYDALGHLLTVVQNAQAASTNQQNRSFTYDLLGRLVSESNPETGNGGANGVITYSYDSISPCGDGNNYSSPGDLVQRKDNAGNVTCFTHDVLHRVLQEGNSTSTGATIRKFFYDSKASYPTGVTVANGSTHMVEAQTLNTSNSVITDEFFSYSPRGAITDFYESTPNSSGFYHLSATYWPSGIVRNLSGIPGVPVINYGANGAGLDGEGRVIRVATASGTNLVSNVNYSNSSTTNYLGALTSVIFGSQDSDSFTYDSNTRRMLTYSFNVNGALDVGTLTWNTNGTLAKLVINDQIPGTGDSQTCNYSYDDLHRVAGVGCGTLWTQNFTYDPMGNINKDVPSGNGGLSFLPTYSTTPPTNQFTAIPGVSVSYDKNGNLLTDNLNTYTWDPHWGNMLSVNNGASTVNALYDALGRLVEKSQAGTSTEFIYDPTGARIATASGQTLIKAFITLPGGAKAIYTSSGLAQYRHSDWLGSSRLTSTQSRTLYSSSAYAPFGEQYGISGNTDASFTGRNSDVVSSLYDFMFREHSPSQGRWISPDPIGRGAVSLASPQTWNRYAYVTNNPLAFVDSQGLFLSTLELLNSLKPGGGNPDGSDDGGSAGGGNNVKDPESKPNGEPPSSGVSVSAKDPKKNPCVLVAGGVGNNVGDPGFAGVYTLGGDAAFPYDKSVIVPDPDLGQVGTDVLAVTDQALNGPNASTAALADKVVSTTANNDNVLLVLMSGSGQAFSTAVKYGGIGQAQFDHISGIIYVSPGSPGGFPNTPSDIPTMTFEATGTTDAAVAGGNLVGGSVTGTLSQGNLGSVDYPGLQDTPLPCPHSVTCEVLGPNGVLNGVQSDCNQTNGSTDGTSSGELLWPEETDGAAIYEEAGYLSLDDRSTDEYKIFFRPSRDGKHLSMTTATMSVRLQGCAARGAKCLTSI